VDEDHSPGSSSGYKWIRIVSCVELWCWRSGATSFTSELVVNRILLFVLGVRPNWWGSKTNAG
jgi:hypothetical protein